MKRFCACLNFHPSLTIYIFQQAELQFVELSVTPINLICGLLKSDNFFPSLLLASVYLTTRTKYLMTESYGEYSDVSLVYTWTYARLFNECDADSEQT